MKREPAYADDPANNYRHPDCPTKAEHDAQVETTGRPFTDRWFSWLTAEMKGTQ